MGFLLLISDNIFAGKNTMSFERNLYGAAVVTGLLNILWRAFHITVQYASYCIFLSRVGGCLFLFIKSAYLAGKKNFFRGLSYSVKRY